MANPTYYDDHGNITSRGSCDHMSGGMRLSYDYILDVFGHTCYPENAKNVNIISNGLADPDNTYAKFIWPHEHEFDFHITTIHHIKPSTIRKFLENQNVHVIYVTFETKDISLIARNFIYKILEIERGSLSESEGKTENSVKFDYFKELLIHFRQHDKLAKLEKLEQLHELSGTLLDDIINYHIIKTSMFDKSKIQKHLEPHDRLVKLPFNLLYSDKDAIIEILSNFTKLTANESTYRLYEDYMLAQEPILNKFKK